MNPPAGEATTNLPIFAMLVLIASAVFAADIESELERRVKATAKGGTE